MLYTTCVVIILASVCNASTQNVPSEMETFTNVMLSEAKRLCPLANICGNNNLTDETKIETGKISCCEDCSCDANCSKRGDCCFPTEAEKVALLDQRKQQECIASVTLDLLPAEYTKYRFYYMTTSCPDEQDSGQNNTFDCGNVHVAPWGSLFPIYSKSTGKIYKNRACADCHGVRDGVEWFAYMNCKAVDKSQTRYLTVAENINPFSYNSFSEYCQIYFTPTQTIDTEICFPDIIDTCTDTEAMIPEMSEMTSNDVIEACVNGVFAPFHSRYTYANAFCFLCNGGVISIAENCFKYKSKLFGPPENDKTFTCLLNTNFLMSVTNINNRRNTHRPTACTRDNAQNQAVDTCIDVLCPSGQIYDINFNCFYPALTWRVPYYVALRLKFVTEIMNQSTLMTLLQSGSDVSSWMDCPWPKWWAINDLFYELEIAGKQSNNVGSFIIFLKTTQKRKKHISVLKEIQYYMTKPWRISALQTEMLLSSHFLEYKTLNPSWQLNNQFVPEWYQLATQKQYTGKIPFFQQYSIFPIIHSKIPPPEFGKVNKMNFCKMISLEFSGLNYSLILENKLLSYNGTFLFDSEFEVMGDIDGKLEIRICLNDSQFIERQKVKSSSAQTVANVFASLYAAIFIFIL